MARRATRPHALIAILFLGCESPPIAAGATSASAPSASSSVSAAERAADRAALRFAIEGKAIRSVRRKQLVAAVGADVWTAYDPYYNKPKTFRALSLRKVLEHGFAGQSVELASQHFVLRAKDGYTVPIAGKRLLEDGGYIAIDDIDTVNGWQPIGPQQANPGPYYLVWRKDDQRDLTTHPRPWQLASIEISKFENSFPKTVPTASKADTPTMRGFQLFADQCIRCHAMNQEGGKVGPDLNVPQNILEYRPEKQVRAYIKNPRVFRYGNMPANPHLSDADLDALIAYLTTMKDQKQDPGKGDSH